CSASRRSCGAYLPRRLLARLVHLGRGRVRSELLDPLAARAHERERLAGRPLVRVALEVEIENVVPGSRAARARLDLAQLDPCRGERLERTHEAARKVRGLVHQTRLERPLAER